MEFAKFIENLERLCPKAKYFIAKNNPFLIIPTKIQILEFHKD